MNDIKQKSQAVRFIITNYLAREARFNAEIRRLTAESEACAIENNARSMALNDEANDYVYCLEQLPQELVLALQYATGGDLQGLMYNPGGWPAELS